jgi:O-antigen/teichoic acid export membrane protein
MGADTLTIRNTSGTDHLSGKLFWIRSGGNLFIGNRYMAKYRAVDDTQSLRKIMSSVIAVQMVIGIIVAILCMVTIQIMPAILSEQLGSHIEQARSVVFWLGISLAVQIFFSPFTGVITGCHRWDAHNALSAGFHIGIVLAWIIALTMGKGLRSLGIINFIGVTITEIARTLLAYHICPELKIRFQYVNLRDAKKILLFGGKSILTTLSRLLLYQTSSLLVVGYLGPAVLATYSRPNSLINHAMTIVNKFAFVLTPTASYLHARGQKKTARGTFDRNNTLWSLYRVSIADVSHHHGFTTFGFLDGS